MVLHLPCYGLDRQTEANKEKLLCPPGGCPGLWTRISGEKLTHHQNEIRLPGGALHGGRKNQAPAHHLRNETMDLWNEDPSLLQGSAGGWSVRFVHSCLAKSPDRRQGQEREAVLCHLPENHQQPNERPVPVRREVLRPERKPRFPGRVHGQK